MLNSISIENFRGFNHLNVGNFKNINLIGGLNNSGKTALLEALLLSFFPSHGSFRLLQQFRNERNQLIENAPDKVWNYFFYNQELNNPIKIFSENNDSSFRRISLTSTKNIEHIIESVSGSLNNGKERLSNLLSSKFSDTLSLNVKIEGNINFNYFLLPDKEENDIGVIGSTPANFNFPPFLHTMYRLGDKNLTSLYSETKENKKVQLFNNTLKLIDKRIVGSEIDAPGGEPVLKLILSDGESFPLGMFGDAIRKVAELLLIVINTSNGVLFIDELENGIHYTKHRDLWKKLFELADNNLQIFATSHSGEMIKAFNDVAYQTKFEAKAMYFEMSRAESTQEIIVNSMDMEILNYEIQTNSAFRGE